MLVLGAVVAAYGGFQVGVPGAVLTVAVFAGVYLWTARFGVTLAPHALVLHGVTDRELPWSQIQGVGYVTTTLSTSGAVWDGKGHKWILRVPADSPFARDPDLRRTLTRIETVWQQHRGAAWQPDPQIQDAIPPWLRVPPVVHVG